MNKQVILGFTAPTTIATQVPRPVPPPDPVITIDPNSGAKFFGGASDDPFFLDDTGANWLVASSLMNPAIPISHSSVSAATGIPTPASTPWLPW